MEGLPLVAAQRSPLRAARRELPQQPLQVGGHAALAILGGGIRRQDRGVDGVRHELPLVRVQKVPDARFRGLIVRQQRDAVLRQDAELRPL